MPKQGEYRKFILPPEGHCFIVADVDSQETKIMADFSEDPVLMRIYSRGLNPHAITASAISGVQYAEIVEHKKGKHEDLYKGGKVTNLGKNYRMGHKGYDRRGAHHTSTLYRNAHVKWGLTPTEQEVYHWGETWNKTYNGVIDQQKIFIEKATYYGYAETLAGRRFYIHKWDRKHRWKSEGSAIMHPVQGSGADMKYLAIAIMREKFPFLDFWGEIHDEIIYTAKISEIMEITGWAYPDSTETICELVKKVLDGLPYEKAWGWIPKIPFTWTVSYGLNWKDLKEV
jgi:DNA polymerase-1